jgi:hypothetical protein
MWPIYREEGQKQRCPKDLYSHASCKGAHIHRDLPVPNYDYGKLAHMYQSRHPDIVVRCFCKCGNYCASNCL